MLVVTPIPAFNDNYIWAISNSQAANADCVVVDPGDAAVVEAFLIHKQWKLIAILVTHHHSDHIGGVAKLCQRFGISVYGPWREAQHVVTQPLYQGDKLKIDELSLALQVMELPGHTLGHIAFYNEALLFCGDTLFSAGCGRLFEGTAEQMYTSLSQLAALGDSVQIYCTHEYTQANLRFALTVEPENVSLQAYARSVEILRQMGRPTLPSRIGLEKAINPFLRCDVPAVQQAARAYAKQEDLDPKGVFAALRAWKDKF